MSLGARTKQRRRELRMSQAELARRCDMSQATISDLERNPAAKTREIARLAAALGVSALWLAEGIGPMILEGQAHLVHPNVPIDVLRLAEKLLLLPTEKLRAISTLVDIKLQ